MKIINEDFDYGTSPALTKLTINDFVIMDTKKVVKEIEKALKAYPGADSMVEEIYNANEVSVTIWDNDAVEDGYFEYTVWLTHDKSGDIMFEVDGIDQDRNYIMDNYQSKNIDDIIMAILDGA